MLAALKLTFRMNKSDRIFGSADYPSPHLYIQIFTLDTTRCYYMHFFISQKCRGRGEPPYPPQVAPRCAQCQTGPGRGFLIKLSAPDGLTDWNKENYSQISIPSLHGADIKTLIVPLWEILWKSSRIFKICNTTIV